MHRLYAARSKMVGTLWRVRESDGERPTATAARRTGRQGRSRGATVGFRWKRLSKASTRLHTGAVAPQANGILTHTIQSLGYLSAHILDWCILENVDVLVSASDSPNIL